jgi:hypothetical protein
MVESLLANQGFAGSNPSLATFFHFLIFSRERSSTGSNDCFVVVLVFLLEHFFSQKFELFGKKIAEFPRQLCNCLGK